MSRIIRTPTQIHTRKLDRLVAHYNFKRIGFRKVNKKSYFQKLHNGKWEYYPESYFSKHWREHVDFC